jgi:cold-inducible RNA-binding protein
MKLYVGNLSFSAGESELRELFSPYGTVTDVHVVTDRLSGQSRGFAFVSMGNRHEGQAAIKALEGQLVEGRNLTVNEARPKTERPPERSSSRNRR